MYRSAGWPYKDVIEIELLAAGLLERCPEPGGRERMRVTDAGIHHLAGAIQTNRQTRDAHESLIEQMAQLMHREGRLVWTNLSLLANVQTDPALDAVWRHCMPDVFSIRNTTVEAYLEPVIHEIKVSRADLLGDLKRPEKRQAYLSLGGQCWYVLGRDAKGRPIAQPDEIPAECGVMQVEKDGVTVLRMAPKRPFEQLPFGLWMALVKANRHRASLDEPGSLPACED